VFASRVKSLRLHWAYEEGDMLDLMAREWSDLFDMEVLGYKLMSFKGIFKTALPEFKALRDFEWIGYPEMRMDMVQIVLASHKHIHGLGLMYAISFFVAHISLSTSAFFPYIVVGTLMLSECRPFET
jgi:hypothetical protein